MRVSTVNQIVGAKDRTSENFGPNYVVKDRR